MHLVLALVSLSVSVSPYPYPSPLQDARNQRDASTLRGLEWGSVRGEDATEDRGASVRAPAWDRGRGLRSKSPGHEPLRTGRDRDGSTQDKVVSDGKSDDKEQLFNSSKESLSKARGREKRNEPRAPEATPAPDATPVAMAQEMDSPFLLNTSDYEDVFPRPDPPHGSPLPPVSARPKRKHKNPFSPVGAGTYGACAVLAVAGLLLAAGVLGNVSLMCIVCHDFHMRSISHALLASLALCDFTLLFLCLPLVVFHHITDRWLLGALCCRLVPYLEVVSLGVTTFTLCALCIDRFRAANNMQNYYEMIENWASTGAKLAVIWIGALLLALPELLIRQLVTEEADPPGDGAPCERCVIRISTDLPDTLYVLGLTYHGSRLWWYFGCYFCLPTLFTIFCSLATAHKIRQAERGDVRGSKKQIRLESQMNCAVVAVAIVYGFCIIPENICNILSTYMAAAMAPRTLDVLELVSQLVLFCKSAVTPALVFCLCQPFTRAILDCCCCCLDDCGPERSPTATSDDNGTAADLELSPYSTIHREAPSAAAHCTVGTHC